MPRFASLAEYYRHHGRVFALAQELGVTPKQAEAELAHRETVARCQEAEQRLQAKMSAPIARRAPRWDAPWMMQD